jgi:hypothetical protein
MLFGSAAISVHCTKSCIYSKKSAPEGGRVFFARNMYSWFKNTNKKINKRNLLHLVGCLHPNSRVLQFCETIKICSSLTFSSQRFWIAFLYLRSWIKSFILLNRWLWRPTVWHSAYTGAYNSVVAAPSKTKHKSVLFYLTSSAINE